MMSSVNYLSLDSPVNHLSLESPANHLSLDSPVNHALPNIYLPESRIKCAQDEISVGNLRFKSASDALTVYLQQYAGTAGTRTCAGAQDAALSVSGHKENRSVHKRSITPSRGLTNGTHVSQASNVNFTGANEDVETLLTSLVRSERNGLLKDGKLPLSHSHQYPQPRCLPNTDLRQEVEAALLRSAQLLEKVSSGNSSLASVTGDVKSTPVADNVQTTSIVSNVSSTTPPAAHINDLLVSTDFSRTLKKQPGHVYSYRTSRPQHSSHNHMLHQSLNSPLSCSMPDIKRQQRRYSMSESLQPVSYRRPPSGKRSSSLTPSSSQSSKSDPTDVIRLARSRSISPGLGKVITLGSYQQPDQLVQKSVPSWVGELNPSEVSDSAWESMSSHNDFVSQIHPAPPSFTEKMIGGSDIKKDMNYLNDTPSTPQLSIHADNTSRTTNSLPSLNLSDLAITDFNFPMNNFSTKSSVAVKKQPRHSSPIKTRHGFIAVKEQPRHSSPIKTRQGELYSDIYHPQQSRMLDSDYNGEAFLHNNILPQTVKLKKSMDDFVSSSENFRQKSLSSNLSTFSSSSLDTFSLLTGKPMSHSEIMGANTLFRENTLEDPAVKDHGSSSSVNQDKSLEQELEGDRSWEKMATTFKPPVPVDGEDFVGKVHDGDGMSPQKSHEKTFSGGRQPGSMEILKNMLFKLQAEESSGQEGNVASEEMTEESPQNGTESCTDIIHGLQNYDFKTEPGGHSLEKALIHLNRLKQLVQNTAPPSSSDDNIKPVQPEEHIKDV